MTATPSTKGEWRQWFSERRQSLTLSQAQKESDLVCSRLVALIQKKSPAPIPFSLYLPIRGEVDVTMAARSLATAGYLPLFPRLSPRGLEFAPVSGPADLVPGPMGLTEPKQDLLAVRPEVVVLPGLGFSRDFHRLGYGKGHYDRALSAMVGFKPLLIGVGYGFQLVASLPAEAHDQRMDAIVTPESVLERKS